VLYPVIAVLALASIGGGYETVRAEADASAYPMPGQLIDVGGHNLHLSCTGSGSPTVVLQPGGGETSSNLGWIAPAVAVTPGAASTTAQVAGGGSPLTPPWTARG